MRYGTFVSQLARGATGRMVWTTREEIVSACAREPERVADTMLALQAQVDQLQIRLRELERRFKEDSRTSSKPPSSDGYRKPAPISLRSKRDRPSGGQPGHRGHRLALRDDPDHVVRHRPSTCAGCGRSLGDVVEQGYERRQVYELVARMEVTEHQAVTVCCPACGTVHRAAFPEDVLAPTQYGPFLKALVAYGDTYQLLPFERLRELIFDLTGHALSEGTLQNVNEKLFEALAPYEAQVQEQLRQAPVAHFDETGLRVEGKLYWLHSAGTEGLTHYAVAAKRGVEGMEVAGILPQFTGVAVHDGWVPYQSYPQCEHSLCNAHHERELTAVFELDGQRWAQELIDLLHSGKQAVEVARAAGADSLPPALLAALEARYDAIVQQGLAANPLSPPPARTRGRPKKSKARNLLERLETQRDAVLRFLRDFRVPYTNNLAERDVRMVKVQQKISGTFRSLGGARQFCRIRGYISTWKKRGLPVLAGLRDALQGRPMLPTA